MAVTLLVMFFLHKARSYIVLCSSPIHPTDSGLCSTLKSYGGMRCWSCMVRQSVDCVFLINRHFRELVTKFVIVYSVSIINSTSHVFTKYSLAPDPRQWGSDLSIDIVEPDDALHDPEYTAGQIERGGHPVSLRGFANLGCLGVLCVGIVGLLYVAHIYLSR